jgi:hypothetical protein
MLRNKRAFRNWAQGIGWEIPNSEKIPRRDNLVPMLSLEVMIRILEGRSRKYPTTILVFGVQGFTK